MVGQNLLNTNYQSKGARLYVLKQRAERVTDFIKGLRGSKKSEVYWKIINGVTGVNALVTLQSFLLQSSLYFRKTQSIQLVDTLELYRAHEALALYYKDKDLKPVLDYLSELKNLFEMVKE